MKQARPVAGEGGPPEGKHVFRLLVGEDRNNVIGCVAYGVYRRSKLEWEEKLISEKNRLPNGDEKASFDATVTDTNLDSYRNEARSILAEFADEAVTTQTPEIMARAMRGRFWRNVLASMIGSALFAILLLILVLIAARSDIDLRSIFVGR
ncbi:hypothetical protein [Bauldia litoralis]|uniref:hypothetical protein n=1 Tax=Bauldia litoralis TaxID=665467 RepID=UPI003265E12E